jgi:hypothetical protein
MAWVACLLGFMFVNLFEDMEVCMTIYVNLVLGIAVKQAVAWSLGRQLTRVNDRVCVKNL